MTDGAVPSTVASGWFASFRAAVGTEPQWWFHALVAVPTLAVIWSETLPGMNFLMWAGGVLSLFALAAHHRLLHHRPHSDRCAALVLL